MSVAENNLEPNNRALSDVESLPDFERPPVSEVALSLQFEPMAALTSPMIGLLWSQFKAEYPQVEEHQPLPPVIERFGGEHVQNVKVQFQVFDSFPPTRVWFVSGHGAELIQVQPDRFVHNWRRRKQTDEYPRYSYLRARFIRELEVFLRFTQQEQLGEVRFNQTEVTFVNTIVSGEGWERHGQLDSVLTIHSGSYSDDFFSEPENVRTALRYLIPGDDGSPIGRLHINVVPIVSADKKPAFNLTITARCAPNGTMDDAIRSLDLAHRWVVKGFASITTKEMHKIWGRQE